MAEKEKKQDKKYFKVVLIIIISFIVLPLIIISIIYNSNIAFKQSINNKLSKMPGAVGEHFSNYPTEEEKIEKINYLARHFLNLESDVAADKIYIIKREDEGLYFNLIKDMNSLSAKKTEDIVLKIRNMELRKDLLVSTYEEAKDEEAQEILSEISRIENQDILLSIMEIENKFSDKEFIKILNKVNLNKLSEIVYYVEEDIKKYILNALNIDKKNEIERLVYVMEREENNLKGIAKIYETKSIDSGINEIGTLEDYSIDELAIIYMNLSNIKAAKILYNIENEKFIEDLFVEIENQKEMKRLTINITEDISRAMEFISDYNVKINNLVQTYEKMNPAKVSKIVEEMIDKKETIASLELESEELYEISESTIIIDVLLKMKNQTLSKVLDFMEANKASKVTEELARPK